MTSHDQDQTRSSDAVMSSNASSADAGGLDQDSTNTTLLINEEPMPSIPRESNSTHPEAAEVSDFDLTNESDEKDAINQLAPGGGDGVSDMQPINPGPPPRDSILTESNHLIQTINIGNPGRISFENLFRGEMHAVVSVDLSEQPPIDVTKYEWVQRNEEKQVVMSQLEEKAKRSDATWITNRKQIDDLYVIDQHGLRTSRSVDAAYDASNRVLWLRLIDKSDSSPGETAKRIKKSLEYLDAKRPRRNSIRSESSSIRNRPWVRGTEHLKDLYLKAEEFLGLVPDRSGNWPTAFKGIPQQLSQLPKIDIQQLNKELEEINIVKMSARNKLSDVAKELNSNIDEDSERLKRVSRDIDYFRTPIPIDFEVDLLVSIVSTDDESRLIRIPVNVKASLQ